MNVTLISFIYIRWERINTQHSMIINPEKKKIFYSQILLRNIADIYVRSMVIYHPFIDSFLSEMNSQNSIFDFNKYKNELLYNKFQEKISNKYVRIFGNPQQLYH